jgi:hypothetical protein
MAPSPRRTLIADLCKLLEVDHPLAYCDACLALRLEISFEEAKTAAVALSERPGFIRQQRECATCTRMVEVTSVGAKWRRRQ